MGSAAVTTVFQPDPTCFAPSNIWLREGLCREVSSPANLASCSYAYHGNPDGQPPCFPDTTPGAEPTTYYSDCPESFTSAGVWTDEQGLYASTRDPDEGVVVTTICCPNAYSYFHNQYATWPTWVSTDGDGQTVALRLLDKPECIATSVEVLRSEVVTVTLATAPDVATTTTTWAEDAFLYADAVSVTATEYGRYYMPVSTCWGADCPATFTATFPDPPVATPPMARFTPPPECTDPANIWSVTTSCYVESPQDWRVHTPDWLQCAVTQMGGNEFMATACAPSALSNAEGSYYSGCPDGYTAVQTSTTQAYDTSLYTVGYYDAIYHEVLCCPDSFDFQATPSRFGQDITTTHDGQRYGLFRYPLPGCYATSVSALSGKDVPMHTHSAAFGWDKRQESPDFPVTQAWDYEGGTLFAASVRAASTVFMGTHTCYESCSTWISYYYPDSTGGPSPTPTPTPTPTADPGSSGRETQPPSTNDASPEASPMPSGGTGSGTVGEATPEASSTPSNVPESGAESLARVKTVGASAMVALVALWLAL